MSLAQKKKYSFKGSGQLEKNQAQKPRPNGATTYHYILPVAITKSTFQKNIYHAGNILHYATSFFSFFDVYSSKCVPC